MGTVDSKVKPLVDNQITIEEGQLSVTTYVITRGIGRQVRHMVSLNQPIEVRIATYEEIIKTWVEIRINPESFLNVTIQSRIKDLRGIEHVAGVACRYAYIEKKKHTEIDDSRVKAFATLEFLVASDSVILELRNVFEICGFDVTFRNGLYSRDFTPEQLALTWPEIEAKSARTKI